MQGYKSWATFLQNVSRPENGGLLKLIKNADWKAFLIAINAHTGVFPLKQNKPFDEGDEEVWDRRYREVAQLNNLRVRERLFFKMGEFSMPNELLWMAPGCPHDCIHKSVLYLIADHIISNTDPDLPLLAELADAQSNPGGAAGRAIDKDPKIKEHLEDNSMGTSENRKNQCKVIKQHIGYKKGKVPVLALLPLHSTERALFWELKNNRERLDE